MVYFLLGTIGSYYPEVRIYFRCIIRQFSLPSGAVQNNRSSPIWVGWYALVCQVSIHTPAVKIKAGWVPPRNPQNGFPDIGDFLYKVQRK